MIITSTGFFNTGSSAITHMLKEFDDVSNSEGVYEIRLLYDPDGISDLEYHLVDCPHRQNTSYAINRFRKYVNFNSNPLTNHHYEKMCHGNFKKLSYDFIDKISLFNFFSISHLDTYDRGVLFNFINRCYQKLVSSFSLRGRPKWLEDSLVSKKTIQYAGDYKREKFILNTQQYIESLLAYCNPSSQKYILIDQLIPPSNIKRYLRYIPENEDVRVFIVDRDPRDLYVTCKYFLHTNAIPCYNVDIFCNWFRWTREQSKLIEDPNELMRVQFEDLIYHYEETRMGIANFCGLDVLKCTNKKKIFTPEKSIFNTQVWLRYPNAQDEVAEIAKQLKEYCYDFDKNDISFNHMSGKMFDC